MKIEGGLGEIRATLTIKRKETGKVETVEIVGKVKPEKQKEQDANSLNDGQGRRD